VSRLTGAIVQFDGLETYVQKVGSGFDTGGARIAVPYLIAMRMSVSDQPASTTLLHHRLWNYGVDHGDIPDNGCDRVRYRHGLHGAVLPPG
jgi:hypothetical protein